jgi:EAL domain-containing protein (putative c-di-GMP-specific phosphodiesterase class I)
MIAWATLYPWHDGGSFCRLPRTDLSKNVKWTAAREAPTPEPGSVRALTAAELHVVFQPIVNVATGTLFAFEALVRCKHPAYPSPPALFEAAVREEACGRLGRTIRDVAFATCGRNALFVNLHPQELASRWLVKTDDPIGFHNAAVYLEITESAAFDHFELCTDVVREVCKRTSALLVIDDFGAGYSNIERVADLAPAIVKLDLALTRNIHERRARQVVVRHVVAMCAELGARVVAEGVETLDELRCVIDLGVTYAQGYLLARPGAPPPAHIWPLGPKVPPPVPKVAKPTPRASRPPKT